MSNSFGFGKGKDMKHKGLTIAAVLVALCVLLDMSLGIGSLASDLITVETPVLTLLPTGYTPSPVLLTQVPVPGHTPTPTVLVDTFSQTATPEVASTPLPPSVLETPVLIEVTPTSSDTFPIPAPVPVVEMPADTINIVVLGSDQRPDWDDWHTDVVQIVSIQPSVPAVTVLSIPRDLYVYIPGFWMSRINFADMYGEKYGYEGGGPELVKQTILYNLGIPVHRYVRTDFDGFIGIIDTLGGVDIPVHCRLEDHWPYPDENGDYSIKVLEPGVHHMDGETALWYARSRKTSTVFARERRQQQVLQAIWHRARSLDLLPRVPELWETSRSMVVTDMKLEDVVMLADVASRLDEQNVRFRNIGYSQVIPWTTPKGGAVFLPNWERIEPMVSEALGPLPEGRLWRASQAVEVWNGAADDGWDHLAADRLSREGFVVVIGQSDRQDYAQTLLIDLTGAVKGSAVPYLQSMFSLSPENIITVPDSGAKVQYRLVIGADYRSCPSP
jgi:LCP family protein required for cell wall assembly